MINLLPLQEKIKLEKEQNRKLVLVLSFILLISLLCFVLLLLSLYFYIMVQVSYQKSLLDDARQQYQTKDFLQYKSIIKSSNQILAKANVFYKKELYFSQALAVISSIAKPDGVLFHDITMQHIGDKGISVAVTGSADNRENLLQFKTSVEAAKEITSAYFPPDNWIKSKDINFHVTFEIDENPQ